MVQLLDGAFQPLQAKNKRGDVVERPAGCRTADDDLDAVRCGLVLVVLAGARLLLVPIVLCVHHRGIALALLVAFATLQGVTAADFVGNLYLLVDTLPDCVDAVAVGQALENAVATDHDEVEVVLNAEALDIGLANDYVRVASVTRPLGLDIAECFRNRESPREDSERTLDVQVLLARVRGCLCEGLSPIDLAAGGLDADLLKLVVRLVVPGQHADLVSSIYGHDSAGVADVDDVDHFVDNHDDGSAGA